MGILYSNNLNYFFWLLLMPPYIYQASYGILQTFNFCSIQGDSVVLDRVTYNKLFNEPTANYWIDYSIQQIAPNRFNLFFDFFTAIFAAYVNNWILFAWLIASIPVNAIYLIWYTIDPVADMPPFLEF